MCIVNFCFLSALQSVEMPHNVCQMNELMNEWVVCCSPIEKISSITRIHCGKKNSWPPAGNVKILLNTIDKQFAVQLDLALIIFNIPLK